MRSRYVKDCEDAPHFTFVTMRIQMLRHYPATPGIRVLRWLFALSIMYQMTLLFRPDETFLSRPYIEDAFYTLSVARSIGHGTGISVNGLHPTNGFQPLIALLNAPFFALCNGNDFTALRLTLLLQIVIFGLAALALATLVTTFLRTSEHQPQIFWGTSVLAVWNYSLATQMLNGLETGLSVAMVCSAVAYYNARIIKYRRIPLVRIIVLGNSEHRNVPLARFVVLGVLLGIGVLSRIDIAILVPVMLLWHLVRHWWPSDKRDDSPSLGRRLVESMIIGGVALAVSSPWWIYNYIGFGSIMPISGQALLTPTMAQGPHIQKLLQVLSNDLLFIVHITFPIDDIPATIYSGIFLFIGIITAGVVARPVRNAIEIGLRNWKKIWDPVNAAPLLPFALALVIYYTFYFRAPHFLGRYLVLPGLLLQIGIISLLYAIYTGYRSRSTRSLPPIFIGIWVVTSGILFTRNFTMTVEEGNFMMTPAHWIERHTTRGDAIGMFQSGTTEFVCGNVVNLDGKVNADALHALQSGSTVSYIDSIGFDYIIDWPGVFEQFRVADYLRLHYTLIDTLDHQFVVWRRNARQTDDRRNAWRRTVRPSSISR